MRTSAIWRDNLSAYYTYMWDEVIAQDFFQQFDRNNLLAGDRLPCATAARCWNTGGSMSANDLVEKLPRPSAEYDRVRALDG